MPSLQTSARAFGLLALFVVGAVALSEPARAQGEPGEIAVFGDSLSDPGNGFAFVKDNATPPDYGLDALLVPGTPYAVGGHHVTNGATWIEQLATTRALRRSVRPAFVGASPFAMNFAIGTARARDDGANPSLALQVGAFLLKSGGVASPDALYVIQIGGNDISDALAVAAAGDVPGALAIIQAAADAVAAAVETLYASGARRFLVWNVFDAALTPAVRFLDALAPGTAALASLATAGFNAALTAALLPAASLPGIALIPFDLAAVFEAIVAAPASFGFTNVTDACVTPDEAPFRCQAVDEYVFWDGIHPTRAGHAVIAEAVAGLLGL